ncbi:hypothetical protein KAR91_77160 [Candidatus Pacearchaeota archaeon]|nr:hypothetical protein [Candidatus Pacearchaeota archaeon]
MSAEHSLKALAKLLEDWTNEAKATGAEPPERIMTAEFYLTEIRASFTSPLYRGELNKSHFLRKIQQKVSRFVVEGCEKYPGQLLRTPEEMQQVEDDIAGARADKGAQMLHFSQLQNPDNWNGEGVFSYSKPPAVIHTWKLQPQDVTACMN